MNKNIIYGLYCPFMDNLHYVGKSSSYMTRPMQHLNESHSEKINEWVSQLKLLGHKPVVKILEICNDDNIDDLEIKWINKSVAEGAYLLNKIHNKTANILLQKEYKVDNSDIINIGKIIKESRNRLDINQEELSKLAKIDRTTLLSIEKGSDKTSLKNLKNVLNILGFEIIIKEKC